MVLGGADRVLELQRLGDCLLPVADTKALDRLAGAEPQAAQLVHLRYFAGCTMDEAANMLGLSLRSAEVTAIARLLFMLDASGATEPGTKAR